MEEMKNSYENLEDRLKSQADSQQFQYDPEDWKALEAMLDDDAKSAAGFNWRKSALILLLLLVGVSLGVVLYNSNQSSISADRFEAKNLIGDDDENQSLSSTEQKDQNSLSSSSVINSKLTSSEDSNRNQDFDSDETQSEKYISINNTKTIQISGNSILTTSNDLGFKKDAGSFKLENPNISASGRETNSFRLNNLSSASESFSGNSFLTNDPNSLQIGEDLSLDRFVQFETISKNSIDAFLLQAVEVKRVPELVELEKEQQSYSKIFLGINLGMEASKTELSERSSWDLNTGIQVGYSLSRKLQLIGGANYVIDKYMADGDDYKITPKFQATWGAPDYVSANCSMINAHLGVAYHFTEVNRSGFSVSASSVSNFMVSENYDYHYTDATKDWTGQWNGAHQTLFSSLELGVQYKFQLSSRQLFSVGSYTKLATRGIGHGDVLLNSYGFRLGFGLNR